MDTRRLRDGTFRRREQRNSNSADRLNDINHGDRRRDEANRLDARCVRIRCVARPATSAIETRALIFSRRYPWDRCAVGAAGIGNSRCIRITGRGHGRTRHHAGAGAKEGVQQRLERGTVQAPNGDERGQHHQDAGRAAVSRAHGSRKILARRRPREPRQASVTDCAPVHRARWPGDAARGDHLRS